MKASAAALLVVAALCGSAQAETLASGVAELFAGAKQRPNSRDPLEVHSRPTRAMARGSTYALYFEDVGTLYWDQTTIGAYR